MPCKCIAAVDITIYRFHRSVESQQAQDFFEQKGVAYEDCDASLDPKALEKMVTISGQTERPVIVLNQRVFLGFDRAEIEPFVPSFF